MFTVGTLVLLSLMRLRELLSSYDFSGNIAVFCGISAEVVLPLFFIYGLGQGSSFRILGRCSLGVVEDVLAAAHAD